METNRFAAHLVMVGALFIFIGGFGCGSVSENDKTMQDTLASSRSDRSQNSGIVNVDSVETLGQKLSLIEFGNKRSHNDGYVILIDKLIDSLSNKYNEPRDSIADKTWKVYGVLSDMGVKTTFQDIMYGANFKGSIKGLKYNDVMYLYYKASISK
jgi:hypothetical protein